MKRLAALILAVFLLAAVLIVPASAIDPFDTTKPLSLSVSFIMDDKNISGARFKLYRVADMKDYGTLTLTETFKDCGASKLVDLTSDENQKLCETLYEHLEKHPGIVPADSGVTDRSGEISFPHESSKLLPGLYLLVSERFQEDGVSHEAAPFIISLPYRGEDEVWHYDMSVTPKTADTRVDVIKLWQDRGYERFRPAAVRVALLKGVEKKIVDTVVLSEKNQWHYAWENLPGGYQWSVAEDVQGLPYRGSVERVPGGFRIVNTYAPPIGPILPQTGLLWWPVPVLAAAGVLLFVLGWKKLRKCEK